MSKKNMVDFQPGYWEWQVIINGECIYAFDDLTDVIPDPLTKKNLESTVDDLIEQMKWDFETEEYTVDKEAKIILFENLETLKDKMMQRIFYQWGAA